MKNLYLLSFWDKLRMRSKNHLSISIISRLKCSLISRRPRFLRFSLPLFGCNNIILKLYVNFYNIMLDVICQHIEIGRRHKFYLWIDSKVSLASNHWSCSKQSKSAPDRSSRWSQILFTTHGSRPMWRSVRG